MHCYINRLGASRLQAPALTDWPITWPEARHADPRSSKRIKQTCPSPDGSSPFLKEEGNQPLPPNPQTPRKQKAHLQVGAWVYKL